MSKKIAVILFNLGGPDSKESIKPFLLNFFMDKNIITLPIFLRFFIARMIARKRSKREAGDSYGLLGDKSPLLENTTEQAKSLEGKLNSKISENTYRVFTCMRYWHPMSAQIAKEVKEWEADKIVLLPLYPQFSTTTTWSSLQQWNKQSAKLGLDVQTSMICCYPENQGYVEGSAKNILEQYKRAKNDGHEKIRILFSAHGLPEKVIKGGDPYQYQCENSAISIVKSLEKDIDKEIDWQICYQSRVGRLKWIEPSIEQALDMAAEQGVCVIIYPHAFTQEHVETLVELDIEYKKYAEEIGIEGYYRAQTLGVQRDFIAALGAMVKQHESQNDIIPDDNFSCPKEFGRCCKIMMDKV